MHSLPTQTHVDRRIAISRSLALANETEELISIMSGFIGGVDLIANVDCMRRFVRIFTQETINR